LCTCYKVYLRCVAMAKLCSLLSRGVEQQVQEIALKVWSGRPWGGCVVAVWLRPARSSWGCPTSGMQRWQL
jgi:hypothetical protein